MLIRWFIPLIALYFVGGLLPANAAEEHAMALQWEGVQGLATGTATTDDNKNSRLRMFLSSPDRECTGSLSVPSATAEGLWIISCPDGVTASGQFKPRAGGKGGDGSGIDSKGRKVLFTVSVQATNTQSAAAPAPSKPPSQQSAAPPSSPYSPPASQPQSAPQVAAAPPKPATPPQPQPSRRFSNADEVRQWAYTSLMERLEKGTVSDGTGVGQSYIGKPINYRGKTGAKVLVVCIDWGRSSSAGIWSGGSAWTWQDEVAPRMQSLREQADTGCAKNQSKGCKCQFVDENNKSVLKVPDEFVQKVMAALSCPGISGPG